MGIRPCTRLTYGCQVNDMSRFDLLEESLG